MRYQDVKPNMKVLIKEVMIRRGYSPDFIHWIADNIGEPLIVTHVAEKGYRRVTVMGKDKSEEEFEASELDFYPDEEPKPPF